MRQVPFSGQTKVAHCTSALPPHDTPIAVAIPMLEEADLLPACLTALDTAIERASVPVAVVLVVHDSRDASYRIAADWIATRAGLALDVSLAPAIRNAPHARRLAMDIAVAIPGVRLIMTSDADSRVGADWCERTRSLVKQGADCVIEDVRLDTFGARGLPPHVIRQGELERAYRRVSSALWHRWSDAPLPPFAWPASGASMAVRAELYRELGGMPLPVHGEDRALCEAVRAAGHRVAIVENGGTTTSARLEGRAEGGCAGALASRSRDHDPECDDRLLPMPLLKRLADGFDIAQHAPMRVSELERELGVAKALLDEANRAVA